MHFFTEESLLIAQPIADAYGPKDGNAQNIFNVAATCNVSADAKVFACTDAMMIVLPYYDVDTSMINTNLVNIILKPIKTLNLKYASVEYFVYRGVKKESLIIGGAITPSGTAGKTDFIKKFWENWLVYKADADPTPTIDPGPESFGFTTTLPDTTLIEEIFNSAESNDLAIKDLQAIKVSEGQWIGQFLSTEEIRFEIITDADHLDVDLEYVKKSKIIMNVTGYANSTLAELFILRAEREKILNYIDPAAFFGNHYETGVGTSTFDGTGVQTIVNQLQSDVYIVVLPSFYTKNRVYIDIRNERGYSYNYDRNYNNGSGLNMQFAYGSPYEEELIFTLMDTTYHRQLWPLFYVENISGHETYEENSLHITLRRDDNVEPILHHGNDIYNTEMLSGGPAWTSVVNLFSPNIPGVGPAAKNIAFYHKLQYFRAADEATSPTTVFKNTSYLNAAYGGMDMPSLEVPTPFQHIRNTKRHFVKGSNFSYIGESGVYQDDNLVLFYVDNTSSIVSSGSVFPKINIEKTESQSIVDSPLLKKDTIYNKWQVDDGTGTIEILEIVGYNKTARQTTPIEDLLFLGLTKSELITLNSIVGVSDLHQKYFVFEEMLDTGGVSFKDTITNTPYKKFKLKVQGLDDDGKVQVVETIIPAADIFVYGSALNMLCSKDFAASSNVDKLIPDPGTFTEFDHSNRFDYDSNDPIVTGIFPFGFKELDDFGGEAGAHKAKCYMHGEIFYPVDSANSDVLSTRNTTYPLIMLSHANGGRYTDYRALGEHLAKNGFVTCIKSSLKYMGYDKFDLYDTSNLVASNNLTYSAVHPDYYYIHDWDDMDSAYIYSDNNSTQLNGNYAYQKLTVVKGIWNTDTNPNPNTFTVTSEDLLTLEKGVDFDILLDGGGDIESIKYLTKIGDQGMFPLGRANLLFEHLKIVNSKFPGKLDNGIGLIGHSRGGEAVVKAATEIGASSAPVNLKTISAIASLAPTDIWGPTALTQNIPYFVMYGSMDGDLTGMPKSAAPNETGGFSLYDRAINVTEKSMAFVYGATHNGFVTNNHDYLDKHVGHPDYPNFEINLTDSGIQQKATLGYMNAFFRKQIKGESIWNPIFEGNYIPTSIQFDDIFQQYKQMAPLLHKKIIDFEGGGGIGAGVNEVSISSGIGNLTSSDLIDNDDFTPHDTKGLKVKWNAADILSFRLATVGNGIDVTSYDFVSFRIGHMADISPDPSVGSFNNSTPIHAYLYNDTANPLTPTHYNTENPVTDLAYDAAVPAIYSDLKELKVKLIDANGINYLIAANKIIPKPHFRENRIHNGDSIDTLDRKGTPTTTDDEIYIASRNLTKSAMLTVRISLDEFSNNGVDLADVEMLELIFPGGGGLVAIDDVEFTK
jgi:hypothetical protein